MGEGEGVGNWCMGVPVCALIWHLSPFSLYCSSLAEPELCKDELILSRYIAESIAT